MVLHAAGVAGLCAWVSPWPGEQHEQVRWVSLTRQQRAVAEPAKQALPPQDAPREPLPAVEPAPPPEPSSAAPWDSVLPMPPAPQSAEPLPEVAPREVEHWLFRVVPAAVRPEVAPPEPPRPPALVQAEPDASNVPPAYPVAALRRGVEGTVLVELTIGADGRVRRAAVATSSGSVLLDEAARSQLLSWRFEPARRAGQAVESTFRQPVVFRITG